jgi:death on curing protein
VEYLFAEDIMLIHSLIIDETGGLHGIRDGNSILSAEALPKQNVFGEELYPTVFLKAAVYVRTIIFSHPFVDGNKRTGMTAAFVFLGNNGFKSSAKGGEIKKFAVKIVVAKITVEQIAAWLKRRVKKIKT